MLMAADAGPPDPITPAAASAAAVAEQFNAFVAAGIPPTMVAVMLGTMLGTMASGHGGSDGG
jgi:hypothetical protein